MATSKYWRVRIKKPHKKRYVRYRVIKLGKGIKGIVGIRRVEGKRKGRTELKTILIPKHLDGTRARKYAKMFGGKVKSL